MHIKVISTYDTLLPAMFNQLNSSTNQQLLEKNLCNQSSYYKDDFCYEWKPSRAYHKIDTSLWAKMNGTQ